MKLKTIVAEVWHKAKVHSVAIAIALLLASAFIFSFSSHMNYIPIYHNKISLDKYDSRSKDLIISAISKHAEKRSSDYKEVKISGEFVIYPSSKKYQDIFQTSGVNNGLRFEITKRPDDTYQAGIAIKSDTSADGITGLTVSNEIARLAKLTKYHFDITVNTDNALKCSLYIVDNGNYRPIVAPVGVVLDNTRFSIDDILIGQGFDSSRQFDGIVQDFKMEYIYYVETHLGAVSLYLSAILMLAGFIITGVALRKKTTLASRINSLKYYILVILLFNYPILQMYAINLVNITYIKIVKIIAVTTLIAVTLFTLLRCSYQSTTKAFISSIACAFLLLFTGCFYNVISNLVHPDIFVFAALSLFIIIHFALLRINSVNSTMTKFFEISITVLFGMSIISLIYHQAKLWLATNTSNIKMLSADNQSRTRQPDIYFIISDMYAGQSVLKKHMGYTNKAFLSSLKSLGFFIAETATSNYAYTQFSVPSMLNFSLLPKHITQTSQLKSYYENNEMAMSLKNMGYQFIYIDPRHPIIASNHLADLNLSCSKISDFEGTLLANSLFFRMNKLGDVYRDDTLCGLNRIKEAALIKGRKFVFVHLLSPHFPYVFDSHGDRVPYKNQMDKKISSSRYEMNKEGYLQQLQFMSDKLLETVQYILSHSESTPIIILQGDHGFSLYDDSSFAEKLPADETVNARLRPLGAYLFPEGGDSVLYDSISPINMTRGLMRYYFNRKDLVKTEDKVFWSPPGGSMNFTDVTDIVRNQA